MRPLFLTLCAWSPGCSSFDPASPVIAPIAFEDGAAFRRGLPAADHPVAAGAIRGDADLIREAVLALELAAAGKDAEALALAESLGSRFPDASGAPVVSAVLSAWLRGRSPEAPVAAAGPALASPKGAYLEYRAALEHAGAGRLPEARAALESAYSLDPTSAEIRTAFAGALKEEGLQLYGRGEVAAALERWRRASDVAPADHELRTYIRRAERVHGAP